VGFVDDNRLEHSGSLIKDNVLDSGSATYTAYKILLDAFIVRDEYIASARFKMLMPVIFIRIRKYYGLLANESLKLSLPCHFHCRRSYDKTWIRSGNRYRSDTLHSFAETHIVAIEAPLMLNHVLNSLSLVVKGRQFQVSDWVLQVRHAFREAKNLGTVIYTMDSRGKTSLDSIFTKFLQEPAMLEIHSPTPITHYESRRWDFLNKVCQSRAIIEIQFIIALLLFLYEEYLNHGTLISLHVGVTHNIDDCWHWVLKIDINRFAEAFFSAERR